MRTHAVLEKDVEKGIGKDSLLLQEDEPEKEHLGYNFISEPNTKFYPHFSLILYDLNGG